MPSLTKDHTILVSNTVEIVTLPLDYHVIKAVSLRNLAASAHNIPEYATLAIMSGGTASQNVVAFLTSGYVGALAPLAWDGSIPVESEHHLAALISGAAGAQYRLSCILWKIRLDEKGEFRAEP